MNDLANFLFEAGVLAHLPRAGFHFLGGVQQSVAEHSFRVALIGFVLARLAEDVDADHLIQLCLFHDLPEARTGDLNYVQRQYTAADTDRAVEDLAATVPFGDEVAALIREFEARETRASLLANDADQLEILLVLKEQADLGHPRAGAWLEAVAERLQTEEARLLADEIRRTRYDAWWWGSVVRRREGGEGGEIT
jgi:putative hydrolase of HD superfamily